jgi:hypothetical protein
VCNLRLISLERCHYRLAVVSELLDIDNAAFTDATNADLAYDLHCDGLDSPFDGGRHTPN